MFWVAELLFVRIFLLDIALRTSGLGIGGMACLLPRRAMTLLRSYIQTNKSLIVTSPLQNDGAAIYPISAPCHRVEDVVPQYRSTS